MMRRTLISSALAIVLCSGAYAQTINTTVDSRSTSGSESGAVVIQNSKSERQAPGIGGSGLAVSMGTCLGTSSGGVSAPGFAFVFGGSQTDEACNARQDAILLSQFVGLSAGVTRLCAVKENARALRANGTPCPDEYYPEVRRTSRVLSELSTSPSLRIMTFKQAQAASSDGNVYKRNPD